MQSCVIMVLHASLMCALVRQLSPGLLVIGFQRKGGFVRLVLIWTGMIQATYELSSEVLRGFAFAADNFVDVAEGPV